MKVKNLSSCEINFCLLAKLDWNNLDQSPDTNRISYIQFCPPLTFICWPDACVHSLILSHSKVNFGPYEGFCEILK